MNSRLSLVLLSFGVLLAGLALLTYQLAPGLARATLLAGLIGGLLCVAWGAVGFFGYRSRVWPLLTLVATGFVLLSQMVTAWMDLGPSAIAFLMTAMFVLSTTMIGVLAHAGAPDSAPLQNTDRGTSQPESIRGGSRTRGVSSESRAS